MKVSVFLKDRDEWVAAEAARAINDDYSIVKGLPALADVLSYTTHRNEPLIRRAINANLRLGQLNNAQILLEYAQQKSNPAAGEEALEALATWETPHHG